MKNNNIKARQKAAYIIVCWNNKSLLKQCIESIETQTYSDKMIILIDNNSKDGSAEFVKQEFPEVLVLSQSDNYGFAKGNNIGIQKALEDKEVGYVVLLNTDATLDANWTETVVAAARQRPKLATAQSITLDFFDHNVIDSTHIYVSRNGQATQGSWRLPLLDNHDVVPRKVFGCNAAAMLITRTFIEKQPFADFFDETMFMYLEDVDVAARATVMGWDNYVVPGTRAYHMGSVSSKKKDPSYSLYMTFRNNLGLMIKNLPLRVLLRVLAQMPEADIASIRHLRRIGKKQAVPALIKGRLAGVMYIPIFVRKRRQLKPKTNINTEWLWQLMRKGY